MTENLKNKPHRRKHLAYFPFQMLSVFSVMFVFPSTWNISVFSKWKLENKVLIVVLALHFFQVSYSTIETHFEESNSTARLPRYYYSLYPNLSQFFSEWNIWIVTSFFKNLFKSKVMKAAKLRNYCLHHHNDSKKPVALTG